MAFPGTYNFNYYKGDTHEFRIYPKNADGSAFNLTAYGNATFKIATQRGSGGVSTQKTGYVSINSAAGYVSCAIAKDYAGDDLVAGTTYVYDIQFKPTATFTSGSTAVDCTKSTCGIFIRLDHTAPTALS